MNYANRPRPQVFTFKRYASLAVASILLCGLGLAPACQSRVDRSQVERGRAAFARICASCHGFDGKGSMRPGFDPPPRDLTDPGFQESVSDEQILATLRNGKGQMPPFAALLPDNEQQELLAFIRSLKGKKP